MHNTVLKQRLLHSKFLRNSKQTMLGQKSTEFSVGTYMKFKNEYQQETEKQFHFKLLDEIRLLI